MGKSNKTAYQVSKDTGVSTSTLTNWKYGRYTPKVDKLKALADYFNVPIEYFLEE
nr:MAG TPA: helix-turn-helix domain protein [Caudoviricetes sp.]